MDKIGMGVLGGIVLLGIGTFMAPKKKPDVVQVIPQPQPAKQVWALGSDFDRPSLVEVPLDGGKRKRKRRYTKKLGISGVRVKL